MFQRRQLTHKQYSKFNNPAYHPSRALVCWRAAGGISKSPIPSAQRLRARSSSVSRTGVTLDTYIDKMNVEEVVEDYCTQLRRRSVWADHPSSRLGSLCASIHRHDAVHHASNHSLCTLRARCQSETSSCHAVLPAAAASRSPVLQENRGRAAVRQEDSRGDAAVGDDEKAR